MKIKTLLLLTPLVALLLMGQSCSSGGDGGFFKSTDLAETWEAKNLLGYSKAGFLSSSRAINNDNEDIYTITVDPSDSNIVYYGTVDNGMFKTVDQAENWTQLANISGPVLSIAVNPKKSNNLIIANNTNISRSIDGGENWEVVHTDPQMSYIRAVAMDWYNPKIIYSTGDSGVVVRSKDGGDNWEIIYQIEDEGFTQIEIDPFDSRIIYLVSENGALYKSTDTGKTWIKINEKDFYKDGSWPFDNSDRIYYFKLSPAQKNMIIARTRSNFIRSTDGGDTWEELVTLLPSGSDQHKLAKNIVFDPKNKDIIYFTVNNVIHKTTNNGLNWHIIESFPSSRPIFSMTNDPENGDILYGGTRTAEDDSGFIK
ncbi:MAG: YCF48-related protein [Patescibacteria group bacterium]|nr:hypothetical protein [Patescibacteria group bacterium]